MALNFDTLSAKFEFDSKNRIRFYEKLRQLLINGVNLDSALEQIYKNAARNKASALPKLYKRWRHDVSNGRNFGHCLAPYIPSIEAILLETGANTGKLTGALENAISTIEQQTKVKKAIINSAAYPIVLTAMLIAAMLMASYQVIPTFEEIIPVEEWTGMSYMVAMVAKFIRESGLIIMIFLVFVLVAITLSLPRWTGKSRLPFENLVPWSLYRIMQGSAFLLSVASMMNAGVKLDENSLRKISAQSDPYLRERIRALRRYIASGENLGDALAMSGYNFPDEEIISDLQIYANLRGFDQNLIKITQTWVDSLVEKVTINMKVINTIILGLIAVVIGCLIMSFYGVFQQIQQSQQQMN